MTLIRNRVFKFEKLEPLIQKKENQLYCVFRYYQNDWNTLDIANIMNIAAHGYLNKGKCITF